MGSARYIGRIGGLAVALGVGLAVAASPGIAWADDPGSASSENAGSVGATDADGSSESERTRPGREVDDSADEESGADDPAEPVVDSVAEDTEASDAAGESDRPRNRKPRWTRAATDADSDTKAPAPLGLETSVRQRVVVDRALEQPAATRAAATVSTSPSAPPPPDVIAHQEVSAIPAESTPPTSSSRMTVSLKATNPGPSVTDGPLLPVDSPVESALAAWGTRQRTAGAALTARSVENGQTFAAAMAAPTVPGQSIGIPDPVTGVVTGSVVATDPESDALTFALATEPAVGEVELNAQTGAYTYAPTQAARLAAGATTTTDTDTFSVTVGDGQQTSIAVVSVYIAPARLDTKPPIAVGTRPSAMVVTSDGRMFVANTGGNTVSVINTVTGQRFDANSSIFSKDIAVGSSPSALALSADGKRLYVANTGSGSVSVIDTATYKRIDANASIFSTRISVGSSPSALVTSGTRLYVANRGSNTVSVIDTATNKLIDVNPNASGNQSISVGSSPSALALVGNRLYVANRGGTTVSVIDTATNSVTATIGVGSQPSSLALGSGGRLYVVNTGSGTVSVINTATNALASYDPNGLGANPIPVGTSPSSVALSPDGGLAYVSNGDDSVAVIDTEAFRVIRTEALDSDPTGGHVVTVSPDGTLYVTDAADNTVRALTITPGGTTAPDATKVSVIGDIGLAGFPSGPPVMSADGSRAVIITGPLDRYAPGVRRVVVINTVTGDQIGGTVALDGTPANILLTADGKRAVITNVGAGGTQMAVIDLASGTQIGTTVTRTGDWSLQLLTADGSRALVSTTSNAPQTQVAVINTATGAQTGVTLTVNGPWTGTPKLNTDGSRAMVITSAAPWEAIGSTRVAVLDTVTGTQVGTTLTLTGNGSAVLHSDGRRALISTIEGASSTGFDTQVTALDLSTGVTVGTTFTLAGDGSLYGPRWNADGTRAFITTRDWESGTGASTIQMTVMDTATGAQVGTTFTPVGEPWPALSADRQKALIFDSFVEPAAGVATQVTVIDLVTGSRTTTTRAGAWRVPLAGSDYGPDLLNADGSRALIVSGVADPNNLGKPTTLVAVIDTITGVQIGSTLTLLGNEFGSRLISLDGSRALIVTNTYDGRTGTNTTRLSVIDTTTGAQVGTTSTLVGFMDGVSIWSSTDTRRAVILTTSTNTSTTGIPTTQVVVIDAGAGTQVGTTLTLDSNYGTVVLSADGTRALMATASQLAVINTANGTLAGPIIAGAIGGSSALSSDGTRAVSVSANLNLFTSVHTDVMVLQIG